MSIRRKARSFFGRLSAAVAAFNRYEAAMPGYGRRGIIPHLARDARHDADPPTRLELFRKIDYWRSNSWLVKRLSDVYTQYTVGPHGLLVEPATSDQDFNESAASAFADWCTGPGKDSNLDMAAHHRILANAQHLFGEFFIVFTSRKPKGGYSIPAIQIIEGHRVGSSDALAWGNDKKELDGVTLDSDGRPTGYHIQHGIDTGKADWLPAFDPLNPNRGGVLHIHNPHRAGMPRGISPYHACLNRLQDIEELEEMEQQRARANAEVAYWIRTQSGELPDSDMLRKMRLSGRSVVTGDATANDEALEARLMRYRRIYGSRVDSLKTGEDVLQIGANNPSAATQWFWKLITEQVCMSVDIPILLVLPESYQGTTARGIYDDANICFRSGFHFNAQAAIAIYLYWLSWARYYIPSLADPPGDWQRCRVAPPRAVNVDVGRQSQAMLAEWAAGATNLHIIAAQQGTTPRHLVEQKADDIVLIKQVAAEKGIKPEEISAPLADLVAKLVPANSQEEPESKAKTTEEINA